MSLYINTNVSSLNAQRNLFNNTNKLNSSLEKLSSGMRINRASDGAGDLLASESLRSQIRGLGAANRNIQQGISMLDMADGALQTIYDDLQRIREVVLSAANDGITSYAPYNTEINGLRTAIDQVATNTVYNGTVLLDSSAPANFAIQSGADAGQEIDLGAAFNVDAQSAALGIAAAAIANQAGAQAYLATVDTAIGNLAGLVATVGSSRNTLENQLNVNMVSIENYTSAEAAIRNTDVAAESSNLIKAQVLQQSSAIALAQANQGPAIALTLLQGL